MLVAELRSELRGAKRLSSLLCSPSHLTAKPAEAAGAHGGASAGDRRAALQARLRQVCGGGMFSHPATWAQLHTFFTFYTVLHKAKKNVSGPCLSACLPAGQGV